MIDMEDIERTVVQHTEQIKTLFSRVEQQEKMMQSINDLTLSVKELALGQKNLKEDVKTLRTDMDDVKSKPGKKWEDVTSKILWAVLAAVVGLVLGKFGLQ